VLITTSSHAGAAAVDFAPFPPTNPLVIPIDDEAEAAGGPGEPRSTDSAGGIIAADLENTGRLGFLVTLRNFVGVYAFDGRPLWTSNDPIRVGSSLEREGGPGHHGAGIQAYDVDDDGRTEALYLLDDGRLVVRDAATGNVKWKVAPPPSPSGEAVWEYPVVANLRGEGPREIVLQASRTGGYRVARFLAAFAIEELRVDGPSARPLWTRDDYLGCNHTGVRVADINLDGRDEIIGAQIIDGATGRTLFELPDFPHAFNPEEGWYSHLDAILVADVKPDRQGLEVVALEEKHPERVFLYDEKGLIWASHHRHQEPQNAAVGSFRHGDPGVQIWCRSRYNEGQKPFVFDAAGNVIFEYDLDDVAPEGWTSRGIERIEAIHWNGKHQHAAGKERHRSGDICIWNPLTGEFVHHIKEQADRLYVADVLGDWREELIVLNGKELRIYWNDADNPNPGRQRLWRSNAYQRSKQNYNYYSA